MKQLLARRAPLETQVLLLLWRSGSSKVDSCTIFLQRDAPLPTLKCGTWPDWTSAKNLGEIYVYVYAYRCIFIYLFIYL